MTRQNRQIVFAAGLSTAWLFIAAQAAAQQVGRAPVEATIVSAPAAINALGRQHIVYELHLTNLGMAPVSVEQLDVLDATGNVIESLNALRLAQRTFAMATAAPRTMMPTVVLQPGARNVVYMWSSLAPGATLTSSLSHRLVVSTATVVGGSPGTIRDTMIVGRTPVAPAVTQSIGSPLGAGTWVAIRGPSNTSGHRTSIVVSNGHAGIPQRFAVDWALLGTDGRLFHGDSTHASNWYGFGAPVVAIANGTVVYANDGASDRAAFSVQVPAVIQANEAMGNSIILDIGGGQYATYAHLKQGSVRVKRGDRVTSGQAIAALGNTGNTLGPHLHFHISTDSLPLGGEGVPFVFQSFELLGRIGSTPQMLSGQAWLPSAAQPARVVQGETPLENMVVRLIKN